MRGAVSGGSARCRQGLWEGPGLRWGSARGRSSAGGRHPPAPRGARREGGGVMAAVGPEGPRPSALALLGPAPSAPSCPHGEPGPGGHVPSVPVLGSRCAPGTGCNAAALAKALFWKLGSCSGAVKQIYRCSLCYRILAFVPRSRTSVCEDQPRKGGRKKILCLFGL